MEFDINMASLSADIRLLLAVGWVTCKATLLQASLAVERTLPSSLISLQCNSLLKIGLTEKYKQTPQLKLGWPEPKQFLEKVWFSFMQCSRCDISLKIGLFSCFCDVAPDKLLEHTVGGWPVYKTRAYVMSISPCYGYLIKAKKSH